MTCLALLAAPSTRRRERARLVCRAVGWLCGLGGWALGAGWVVWAVLGVLPGVHGLFGWIGALLLLLLVSPVVGIGGVATTRTGVPRFVGHGPRALAVGFAIALVVVAL